MSAPTSGPLSAPQRNAPATRLMLVRHGEAEGNRELRYLGRTDARLTERGRKQATALARPALWRAVSHIYTSPLLRALRTAEAIDAVVDGDLTIALELREMDFGAWEGLTRAEVREHDAEALAAWEAGVLPAPPGGESLDAVYARVVAFADGLAARHAGETLALVSHVTPIKMLACAALGLPPEGARRMWLDPASITLLDWHASGGNGPRGVLRLFNETAHLGEG